MKSVLIVMISHWPTAGGNSTSPAHTLAMLPVENQQTCERFAAAIGERWRTRNRAVDTLCLLKD